MGLVGFADGNDDETHLMRLYFFGRLDEVYWK